MSPDRVIGSNGAPRWLKWFVYLCLLAGLIALPLAVSTAFSQNHLQDQRNKDRVAADQAACERGNVFRQQVIDIGEANRTLVFNIIDPFLPASSTRADVRAARTRVLQLIDDYGKAVAKVTLTDCKVAVPESK